MAHISSKPFGTTSEGTPVNLYTLANDQGFEVSITNYGGAITSIKAPDRNGNFADVVLGYDTLDEYVKNPRYFGCLIGRHGNRIALGRFTLNGETYQLAQNNGANHLHGGPHGFDKRVWSAHAEESGAEVVLQLSYLSKDGEENYPGDLLAKVNYALTPNNELRIEYLATTDKDTIVNLTNHSYFNLAGGGDILGHQLQINAGSFTPVTKDLIPTGEIREVRDTPMDFTAAKAIGADINTPYDQLGFTGGYDHNFVLDGSKMKLAAELFEPKSGRRLRVHTTEPGLQFYSGNFLDGSLKGKGGVVYEKYAGLCLETQHFPDTPNHENFPTTVLRVGQKYEHVTVFEFSTV
ncbi:MAG TPA: aldose epimerase family protein [Pyrinomonadaceae bacterium]